MNRRSRCAVLALAAVLAAAVAAEARSGWLAQVRLAAPPAAKADGITVHGHWRIVVRDRRGRVVARRVFHNDLTANGAELLARVLSRTNSAGLWYVRLGGPSGVVCTTVGVFRSFECNVVQAPTGGLSVSAPLATSNPDRGKIFLSGQATANGAIPIDRVSTGIGLCPASTAPSACTSDPTTNGLDFTFRQLPAPVAVAAGQIVQFQVVLSFS
jgi:hypothetical protein